MLILVISSQAEESFDKNERRKIKGHPTLLNLQIRYLHGSQYLALLKCMLLLWPHCIMMALFC